MNRIAILGGGVTGLAAAYELAKSTNAHIDLYESGNRLGGKVHTEECGDLLIEVGPDCFFTAKPGMMELIRQLGLEDQTIAPAQKEFSMLVRGELHRVPGGIVRLASPDPFAIQAATFLSQEAKDRALREKEQPPATEPDESIQNFFSRRFGPEFSRLVAEPLLAGTHGGNADRLSMRALYPNYYALESGNRPTAPTGSDKPMFLSFHGGMQILIDTLAANLGRTTVHLNAQPTLQDLEADQILLALPANAAAPILEPVNPDAAEPLRQIPHRSSAIVTLAYPAKAIHHPLNGTGFLVPDGESDAITGATWSSRKWQGRAPEDTVLIRVFMGGNRQAITDAPDAELIARAEGAIRPLLGIDAPPRHAQATRWVDALPQYELGHHDRLAAIDQAMQNHPHIHLAGTSFRGVGVPDCLRQGRETAKKIAEAL